jgi:thiosulfate/3-mercaptopyruvate sulfurtransferase
MPHSPLVTPDWLKDHLADPQVVVVDCRFSLMEPHLGRQQYHTAHIPGAYYLDLNQDLSSPVGHHGGRHPLPEVATLAAKLSRIGVTSETMVVAYDASRLAFAARLWWLLRYLGHDRVAVLEGGWQAWQASDYPFAEAIPSDRSGEFIPQLRADWVVDIAAVKARPPGTLLVDAREPERYRGEQEPIDPVAGHIPGALNYPWQALTTAEGRVRSVTEQRDRWATLPPHDGLVVYCGSGVTACVNLLSLELAGLPPAQLYAGSWSDWCSYLEEE